MDPPNDLVIAEFTQEMFGFTPELEPLAPADNGGFSLHELRHPVDMTYTAIDLRPGVESQLQQYLTGQVPPNDPRLEYLIQVIQECYLWERISVTKELAHATWHLREALGEDNQELIMMILEVCGRVYETTAALARPSGAVLEHLRRSHDMDPGEFLSWVNRALSHQDEAASFDDTVELITKTRLTGHPYSGLGDVPATSQHYREFVWEASDHFRTDHSSDEE